MTLFGFDHTLPFYWNGYKKNSWCWVRILSALFGEFNFYLFLCYSIMMKIFPWNIFVDSWCWYEVRKLFPTGRTGLWFELGSGGDEYLISLWHIFIKGYVMIADQKMPNPYVRFNSCRTNSFFLPCISSVVKNPGFTKMWIKKCQMFLLIVGNLYYLYQY